MADIELIIRVPEEDYKNGTLVKYFNCYSKQLDEIIYNSIPLPKGHGRLIDADAYKEKIFRVFPCNDRDDQNIRRSTEMAILSAPTIVEADKEMKHADDN